MRKIPFLIGIGIVIFFNGCAQVVGVETTADAEVQKPLKGVSLSPKSYQETDFLDFMERVDQTQDILTWAGDWAELHEQLAPYTITALSDKYDFIPIAAVGHYIQASGDEIRPLNEDNQQQYLDSTTAFIERYKPTYFGIGVEVNDFAEKNPQGFEEFVLFYDAVYDAIKVISPETKVFTVYQLESMKGLGLWGADDTSSQWAIMEQFKSDLAVFTTYPGLFYKDPAEIPIDHYSEIRLYSSLPIAFMEIGWHSAASPEGWESSEEEQARFIRRFFELTSDLDVEAEIWSFMYDQDTIEPFDSMGLIDGSGREKLAWETWMKME